MNTPAGSDRSDARVIVARVNPKPIATDLAENVRGRSRLARGGPSPEDGGAGAGGYDSPAESRSTITSSLSPRSNAARSLYSPSPHPSRTATDASRPVADVDRHSPANVAAATAHVAQSAATATASAARVVDEVETFVRILESAEVPRVTSAPMAPAQADNATNAGSSQR